MYKFLIVFILLCLLTHSFAESSDDCPTETPVKYYNDTCLAASCEYPFTLESDICEPDCPEGQYFNYYTDRCLVYCKTEDTREEDDILFCDQAPESDNANGCPFSHDYKYDNGSCLSTCSDPYKSEGSEGAYLCKEAECVIELNSDGSRTTTCKDITGTCSSGYFLFDDSTCNKVCPAGFTVRKNAICAFPCGKNSALYSNGRCLDTCIDGYTLRMISNFMVCDKDEADSSDDDDDLSSATVEIYLRYNIPFKDFNSGGYLAKFIAMLAKFLDINSSDIKILSLKEGSTMIESEIKVQSKSSKSATSKANALNKKLAEAIESNNLNLEGIGVLNHHFSVVLPEKEQSGTGNNKTHKKSLYALAVGLGVAILVLLVACKYARKRTFFKVKKQAEEKTPEVRVNNSVSEIPATPEKKRKDEEICSFVVLHNSVSRDTTDQISPLPPKILPETETFKFVGGDLEVNHLSSVLKSARQKQTEEIELCKNGSEKYNIEDKLGAIEEVQEGPLSMGEILKNLDEL